HGLLVGLVSALGNQLLIFVFYPPVSPGELAKYLALGIVGGLLGGYEGREALAGQRTLYEVSRNIGAASDPREIAIAIGEHLGGSKTKSVGLWRFGSQTRSDGAAEPELIGFWAPRETSPDAWLPRVDGVTALAESRKRPSLVLRAKELPVSEREAWEKRGIRSALLVPLVAPIEKRVGLLTVASRRRGFSRVAVRAYLTAGNQAALALENLRLVEEARKVAVLRERQRMAGEIHDTLAQGFTSIVMHVEAAGGALERDTDKARLHLEQIGRTSRESLNEARRLIWALHPEQLEKASLPEALQELIERWSEESGVEANAQITGVPNSLAPVVEATLLRSAQEALANVRKHARANRVALTLSYMTDVVVLDVRDDGVGFNPETVHKPYQLRHRSVEKGGFGLEGMRERAERAGGKVLVDSASGEGTTLAVELPLTVKPLNERADPRN
ncbi:MAG TPA: GAF domain-containing sensor histidine kinase, partial [Rubrobacter sp.]|nr:GAF domain-containing sensor histidine kinase [Rubrobacter sp.]